LLQQFVDFDQFLDYTIGILYTADRDGPTGWLNGPPNSLEPKNFYATRRRTADGRFRFWRWDSEFTLENESEDVSERQGYENPARLHYNLRVNADYRLRFADRVQQLFFNGINGATGEYLLPPMAPAYVSKIAQGESLEKAHLLELKYWYERTTTQFLGPREGVDPKNLAQSGWGVIFAFEDKTRTPAIKEALKELLDLRDKQRQRLSQSIFVPLPLHCKPE
jgi:hypothetical protein